MLDSSLALLVGVEGLASSVTAFRRVFRHAVRTGRRGQPQRVVEAGLLLGQVVKRYVQRRVAQVEQRVVHGTAAAIAAVLAATGGGTGINTADSERPPAIAAGLTDHRWTMQEWLRSQVPLPPWVAPKRRGAPAQATTAGSSGGCVTTVNCGATQCSRA